MKIIDVIREECPKVPPIEEIHISFSVEEAQDIIRNWGESCPVNYPSNKYARNMCCLAAELKEALK